MELYLVEKSDNMITIRIKDADMTIITPLLDKLTSDENVENVRYVEKHPELEDPVLIVKTLKGKPEDIVEKAAGSLSDYFSGLNVTRS